MNNILQRWPLKKARGHYFRQAIALFGFFLISLSIQAQSCPCQDQVNVLLDSDCTFTVTIDNVQAGTCTANVSIIVADPNPANGNIVDCAGRWEYGILDSVNNLLCSGHILAVDDTGPVVSSQVQAVDTIECTYIDALLNNSSTTNPAFQNYLGSVTFEDGCVDCGCAVTTSFYDEIEYTQDCLDENIIAYMTRRWTGVDCNGNQATTTQEFVFVRPLLSDLTLLTDVTIQTCDVSSVTVPDYYPFWTDVFGNTLYLDEVDCNYSVNVSELTFQVCDDGSYKLERSVRVLDWCTGLSQEVDNYVVKVGDFEAPVFTGNAQEIDDTPLLELTNNFDSSSFLALDALGELPTIGTSSSALCSSSFFIDQTNLQNIFGFTITDCAAVDINVAIYTYQPETNFGIPTGNVEWVATNYPMANGIASGVPIGLHALVIETDDNCKNSATAVVLFRVKDLTPPIIRYDDQVNVAVTNGEPILPGLGGYGRIDVIDVDEGSTDNCELDKLLVRRQVPDLASCEASFILLGYDANNDNQINGSDWYDENNNGVYDADTEYFWELVNGVWMTPWREYTEFFCCDINTTVQVELGGWDTATDPLTGMFMPNMNSAMVDVLIEDNIVPLIGALPDVTINCDDPQAELLQDGSYTLAAFPEELGAIRDYFGAPSFSGTDCNNNAVVETISTTSNTNSQEIIVTRTIEVSKSTSTSGSSSSTVTQTITIIPRHDYSICFPPDVTIDCNDPNVTIPGMTYTTGSCDLLAELPYEDQVFYPVANSNTTSCYQILRTYKVLNWAEYDGQSLPVIISRDWDADYNTNPTNPAGDGVPGDEGICVIVSRDFLDGRPDTTWYDRDTDPYNNVPNFQGYWWQVISGSNDPDNPDYYNGPYDNDGNGVISVGEETVWGNDPNDTGAPDDNDYNYGSNGFWQYTQHILIIDDTPPQLSIVGQSSFCSNSNLDCSGDVQFTVNASDNCTAAVDLDYTVLLDVDNDGVNLVNVSSNLVNGVFNARYPIGTHRLIFQATDVCGTNSTLEEVVFSVTDCLAPAPVCSDKLVVNLMAVEDDRIAISEVWATDFTQNDGVGDCSGQGPNLIEVGNGVFQPEITHFSINRVGLAYHPDSAGVTMTCADVNQIVPVEVHAIDELGNHDYCNTFIEVQDNGNLCPAGAVTAEIAGAISTETGAMLEGVEVNLSGPVNMTYMTDQTGTFSFKSLQTSYDYTIEPVKNTDPRNGIGILDLIQIKRHLTGEVLLSSPYQMLAADIDGNGSVSVRDMIDLQKLILYKTDFFETNTSWRFIDKGFNLTGDNLLTSTLPEWINHNDLQRNQTTTDFMAIKVGDLNHDALTQVGAVQSEPRNSAHDLEVFTDARLLQAGETYTFYLSADLSDYLGAQFTTSLAAEVELIDLVPGLLNAQQLGFFPEKGMVTAAWLRNTNENSGAEQLFGLTVRANANVQLSEVLQINSRLTRAESLQDQQAKVGSVQLKVGEQVVAQTDFKLLDAQPNPFAEATLIQFQVPEDGNISFTLTDVNGQVVLSRTQAVASGNNQLRLQQAQFPAAGVYFLNLTHRERTLTQKIIHLK